MGCKIKTNQHGTLALSVHWNRRRFWEGTGLPDTAKNRSELALLANLITAEIRANRFTADRYLRYFPNGNHAHEFRPVESEAAPPALPTRSATVNEYYQLWIKRQQQPFVRAALTRDYRLHITRYVVGVSIDTSTGIQRPLGECPVTEITAPILLQLREKLTGRGLSLKSVRNIMDASFRAMLRDARTVDQLIDRDPFTGLIWPRMPKRPADPFTEEERESQDRNGTLRRFGQFPRAHAERY